MAKLMVDGHKISAIDLDAHFDAQIIDIINIPSRSVADDFAIGRLDELRAIAQAGDDYGRSHRGDGKSVNIEYVSANPTGPMHMGHCRGAVVGDALAKLQNLPVTA